MKLEPKNRERGEIEIGEGVKVLQCPHMDAIRSLPGWHVAWIIKFTIPEGSTFINLCDDCAAKVDAQTEWRVPLSVLDDKLQ